jgi:exopolysaccharide biosynthesis polyprenyl glycosylphosphotransferase
MNGLVRVLLPSDAVALAAAAFAAYWLRTEVVTPLLGLQQIQPWGTYAGPAVIVSVLCLLALAFGGLYEDRRYLSRLEEYAGLVKAVSYAVVAAMGLSFLFKAHQYSRGLLLLFWGCACAALVAERFVWSRIVKARRARGEDLMDVAVLTVPGGSSRVKAVLRRFPELGYRPVETLTIRRGSPARDLRRLEAWLASGRVRGVVVGVPPHRYEWAVPYLAWCHDRWVPYHRLSGAFDALHGARESDGAGAAGADARLFYQFTKRVFDETAALILLLLTAPLWVLIAVAIRLDSPGPVFFVQDRVGRHGKWFRLYKFRTMYAHAPRYAVTVRREGDARVTPVGRWLRRTSLDELPQLLNVLKGEMSLVGPRPEMPFMVRRNTLAYRRRLQVLPGITGLWQAIARNEPLEESLRYDLYYIRHRSFFFDLAILARTAVSVLGGRGAR